MPVLVTIIPVFVSGRLWRDWECFVEYKSYMCVICGFVYEEEKGLPDQGIPAGTRWEDIPDTWLCPDCGASKSDFEMIEI